MIKYRAGRELLDAGALCRAGVIYGNSCVVLRRSPTPSTASNTHVEDVSSSEPPTPTASPRKEGSAGKTLTKKQQRELAPCKLLLEQLEQQDEAWPFLLPVNTKQFPTYKKIIKVPMDLSTIKKKLQDCV
jgi:hypothetical protein